MGSKPSIGSFLVEKDVLVSQHYSALCVGGTIFGKAHLEKLLKKGSANFSPHRNFSSGSIFFLLS